MNNKLVFQIVFTYKMVFQSMWMTSRKYRFQKVRKIFKPVQTKRSYWKFCD
jgi:hypothetical protein